MKNDVKKGVSQANLNEHLAGMMGVQFIVFAIALGLWAGSWVVFGITFVALVVIMFIKPLQFVASVILGVAWGGLVAYIVGLFLPFQAQVVFGVLFAIVGVGYNLGGAEWLNDISDDAK